ncbi:hypothetical protein, partial [Pseudomonas aeruginosa]|uniref:hypothetical protein n=1 Tax=Pseudomonas aeruginosa TaxID=287 RepID=UPI00397C2DA7
DRQQLKKMGSDYYVDGVAKNFKPMVWRRSRPTTLSTLPDGLIEDQLVFGLFSALSVVMTLER